MIGAGPQLAPVAPAPERRRTAMPGTTLLDVMMRPDGRTTGFDYLRVILATCVLLIHSVDVAYGLARGIEIQNGALRPLVAAVVPMFFAVSGFLVAGSLERCRSLVSFAGLRLLRLLPALLFVTAITALVLGPMLTSLPLDQYASDPLLRRYVLTIGFFIQYELPGLFETNPWSHAVNGQLWTLVYEVRSYVLLGGVALVGLTRTRAVLAGLVVAANLFIVIHKVKTGAWSTSSVMPGDGLMLCFFYAVVIYHYRDVMKHSGKLALLAALASAVLLRHAATEYLAPVFVAYLTVYLGLLRPAPTILISRGDFSYGIFLIGFPVQQAVTAAFGPAVHTWYWNITLALPLTVGLAVVSWFVVEKPALALRHRLDAIEQRWLDWKAEARGQVLGWIARPGQG
jgi:peptidoglycan/LPS O-acetylase OafA/YrhL